MESQIPDGCSAVKKDVTFCLEGQLPISMVKSVRAGSWVLASSFAIEAKDSENSFNSCNVEKRSISEGVVSSTLSAKES